MKNDTLAQINIMLIFIIANILAMVLIPAYKIYEGSMGEEENNPWIAVYYLVYIIGITALILYIAKKRKIGVLKGIFYFAIAWSMWYALFPIFYYFLIPYSDLLSLSISILLTVLLVKNPEWYMIDVVGVFVTVGIALILGLSLGLLPILILLGALAIYDAVSVYRTKHMISLADNVVKYKLPALFIAPTSKTFSFKRVGSIEKTKDREAFYMGYGDVLIPSILVVASARYFGILSAIFTMVGATIAMILLSVIVRSGKPQPGLPYLNGGALIGLLTYLIFQHL